MLLTLKGSYVLDEKYLIYFDDLIFAETQNTINQMQYRETQLQNNGYSFAKQFNQSQNRNNGT